MSDDITLQLVSCGQCGLEAIAIYEESRRGSLGSEASSHTGYFVDGATRVSIANAISACPSPRSGSCQCASHRALGARDSGGRWDGPRRLGVDLTQSFPVTLAS